jgi:VCBS repeat-containing protein
VPPKIIPSRIVLANGTDADNDALAAVFVGSTSHGSVTLNADGSFAYTPAADYSGPDSFTYKANEEFDQLKPTKNSINDSA